LDFLKLIKPKFIFDKILKKITQLGQNLAKLKVDETLAKQKID